MESHVCWKEWYMFQNKYKPCKLKSMYTVSQSYDQQLGQWVAIVYSVPLSELVAVGGVQSWAASEPCCLCPHTVQSRSGYILGAWRNGCPPPTTPEYTQPKVSHQSGWHLWLQKTYQGFIQDFFLGGERLCAGKLISCGHRLQPPRGVWGHAPPGKFRNFKPSKSDF